MEEHPVKEKKGGKIAPIILMVIGVAITIFSGVLLYIKFGKLTDVRFVLLVHFVIALLWIIQGIICSKKAIGHNAYIIVAIIMLLPTGYALLTTHTMTDYIVKSQSVREEYGVPYQFKRNATMGVSSESLHNGVWDDSISNLGEKKNEIPQISFDEIQGAESYAIYMLDESAGNWVHWKASGIKKTTLEQNEKPAEGVKNSYKGPYPPSGTHNYVVYVFALKKEPDDGYPGVFDNAGIAIEQIYEKGLDIADGKPGNVLAYGYLEGTYTAK